MNLKFITNNKNYNSILQLSNIKLPNNILSNTDLYLYIPNRIDEKFNKEFYYYIDFNTNILHYDNLNHLCMIVKNGGPQLEQMIIDNLPFLINGPFLIQVLPMIPLKLLIAF